MVRAAATDPIEHIARLEALANLLAPARYGALRSALSRVIVLSHAAAARPGTDRDVVDKCRDAVMRAVRLVTRRLRVGFTDVAAQSLLTSALVDKRTWMALGVDPSRDFAPSFAAQYRGALESRATRLRALAQAKAFRATPPSVAWWISAEAGCGTATQLRAALQVSHDVAQCNVVEWLCASQEGRSFLYHDVLPAIAAASVRSKRHLQVCSAMTSPHIVSWALLRTVPLAGRKPKPRFGTALLTEGQLSDAAALQAVSPRAKLRLQRAQRHVRRAMAVSVCERLRRLVSKRLGPRRDRISAVDAILADDVLLVLRRHAEQLASCRRTRRAYFEAAKHWNSLRALRFTGEIPEAHGSTADTLWTKALSLVGRDDLVRADIIDLALATAVDVQRIAPTLAARKRAATAAAAAPTSTTRLPLVVALATLMAQSAVDTRECRQNGCAALSNVLRRCFGTRSDPAQHAVVLAFLRRSGYLSGSRQTTPPPRGHHRASITAHATMVSAAVSAVTDDDRAFVAASAAAAPAIAAKMVSQCLQAEGLQKASTASP
jgi:hypothetical protein